MLELRATASPRKKHTFSYMWHCTEFFAVHAQRRQNPYPFLLPECEKPFEVPELLAFPTPPVLAYYTSVCMRLRSAADLMGEDKAIVTVLLSEWAVLALFCFLDIARLGIQNPLKSGNTWAVPRQRSQIGYRGLLLFLPPWFDKTLEVDGPRSNPRGASLSHHCSGSASQPFRYRGLVYHSGVCLVRLKRWLHHALLRRNFTVVLTCSVPAPHSDWCRRCAHYGKWPP